MRTRSVMSAGAMAVAVAVVTVMLAAGCTAPAGPTPSVATEPAGPPPLSWSQVPPASLSTAPGFGYADPGEVCRRFLAALYSADTVHDAGPADAFHRAAAFADAAFATQIAAAGHDGRWATWVEHQARLVVDIADHADVHQQPDSTIEADRAFRVTITPVGADGWRGWTEQLLVYCTARRDTVGWRVATYDVYPMSSR